MKILAFWMGEIMTFNSIEEAAAYSNVSEKRIMRCIQTGESWKCWTFDELEDSDE